MSLYVFLIYMSGITHERVFSNTFSSHDNLKNKIGNISPWVIIAAISSFCFIRCLFWMEYTQYYSSKKVTAILLEKVCNLPSGKLKWSSFIICFNINIKSGRPNWIVGVQTKHVYYSVPVNSPFWVNVFFSNPWKLKSGKMCVDERKISPNW